MQIGRLEEKHAEDAARLFGAAYARECAASGILSERGDLAVRLAPRIARLAAEHSGVAAVEDGRLCGYLAGLPLDAFKGPQRGVYCPEWAHSAAGPDRTRIYHGLYAEAARHWVAEGCFAHALTLFAHDDEARDAWFWEGFGLLVVDAMRPVEPVRADPPAGIEIRRATISDVDALVPLQEALARHIAGSPILVRGIPPVTRERVAGWLSRRGMDYWLALRGGELIGYLRTQAADDGVAAVVQEAPANRAITGTFTVPEARGQGVATALLNHMLDWARDQGCQTVSVDFESQNGEGRRFWLRRFTPVCYSLLRRVDERPSVVLRS